MHNIFAGIPCTQRPGPCSLRRTTTGAVVSWSWYNHRIRTSRGWDMGPLELWLYIYYKLIPFIPGASLYDCNYIYTNLLITETAMTWGYDKRIHWR